MLIQQPVMPAQRGFSLIELLIGIALIGILLALAAPNFFQWIQSSQIRTQAESVQNGLQLARAEAVRRNANIRFHLTSSIDGACAVQASGTSWVITPTKVGAADNIDPAGACDVPASDTVAPFIIQKRSGKEGSPNAVSAAGQQMIEFNALGRAANLAGASVDIDITNPTGGVCALAGPMRCLRVVVSLGGQIRMCDPAVAAPDSRAC
jgi:type IV fimbrial biogenesis protein FimT